MQGPDEELLHALNFCQWQTPAYQQVTLDDAWKSVALSAQYLPSLPTA